MKSLISCYSQKKKATSLKVKLKATKLRRTPPFNEW
jgi:hypothetical protein